MMHLEYRFYRSDIPSQLPASQSCGSLADAPSLNGLFLLVAIPLSFLVSWGTVLGQQGADQRGTEQQSWHLLGTNCRISPRLPIHRLSQEQFHSEAPSEYFSFSVFSGDELWVGYAIPPAYVIPDLDPSVYVRANRPGVQMWVRVVLPHTIGEDGESPLTTMISGPVYRDYNRWRKLSFGTASLDISKLVERRLPYLRTKFGSAVNARDAYVDQIVVDLVGGPGDVQVWLDDVEVAGSVQVPDQVLRRAIDAQVVPAGFTSGGAASAIPDVQIEGTVMEVDGNPLAARVIEHNGEPFEFLGDLGFNIIRLRRAPSVTQLADARRLGLWLIAPPPGDAGLNKFNQPFDRVLAWHLGDQLTSDDLLRTETLIREIRFSDSWPDRPLIAGVANGFAEFARLGDILVMGKEPIGSSFILSQYSNWLRETTDRAGQAICCWSVMQTDTLDAIRQQVAGMADAVPPLPIEPQQLQFLMYETVAGGARGHWFSSTRRLDGSDPQSRLRATTLRWINAQLEQMKPWIAGGAVVRNLDSRQGEVEITTLKTSRSQLLLLQRPTRLEQWVAGTPAITTVTVNNPSASSADQIFQLTEHSLQPLERGRQINSGQIKIEDCPANVAIMLTQEPLVIRWVSEAIGQMPGPSMLDMHRQLTQQWLALTQVVIDQLQRSGQSVPEASGLTNQAVNLMRQVSALTVNQSQLSAVRYLHQADQKLAAARAAMLLRARRLFTNSSASPLYSHMALLPAHWETATRLSQSSWKPNGLVGGEFEQLQQLTDNGWENHRGAGSGIETRVEITPDAGLTRDQNGLLLASSGSPGNLKAVPLWIQSAKVPIRAGQIVKIHGWVHVAQPITGSYDGLLIFDSLGGRALAERIRATRGWQEFSLYRGAIEDTELVITFALTGIGRVMLDEVTVRTADLIPESASTAAERESTPR